MTYVRSLLVGVGAVVGVGILAIAILRGVAPETEAPATPAAEVVMTPDPAVPPATAPAVNAAATEPPPPWATVPGAMPGSAAANATDEAEARRERQLAELQQSMSAVLDDALERSASTSIHLRKALDTLEAMDDPAVKAHVNLAALRHNFEISVQMQEVARQLKNEVGKPRSAEGDARIEVLRAEFAELLGQMRNDMSVTGAGLPTATPRTPPAPLPLPLPPPPGGTPDP